MKVTKGHFNRKVLFFGLLLFLAISLISTGFAAWIMSTGAEAGSDSNIHVGTVTDGSLDFGDITFVEAKKEIILDALISDQQGDIKGDNKSEGVKDENLSVVFSTTLTPATYVQDLTISIKIPASVKAAADQGYITMPKCCYVDKNPVLVVELIKGGEIQSLTETGIEATIENVSDTYNITITVNFGWGTQFGGENPGIYLDKETDGVKFTYDQKVQKMVDFKSTIYGLTVAKGAVPAEGEVSKDAVLAYNTALAFDILLTAVAK